MTGRHRTWTQAATRRGSEAGRSGASPRGSVSVWH
jgi:hypothetical protein